MLPRAATGNPFDLFAGLPLHPLAVHVPVVLLPLGAIGLLLVLAVPGWRAPLAWPVVAILGVAAAGALVAKLSGEALAARVGSPGLHEQLGNWLLATAVALFAAALAWWLWQRRATRTRRSTGVVGVLAGTLLGALAAGAVIVAVLTGHSGATAAWQDRIAVPAATGAPGLLGPSASPAPTAATGISIAEVAVHDDSASCWVAIEGTVYDVTAWIPRHPGGPERILGICGTDASEEFGAQHAGQALPTEQLSQFAIGELAER
ncbi:cytochrome b5-like heme/steroid binding domain-containing protein [Agrococcus sp. HG114]|uniref:cytochrome b5 domain-containing protein n=1 Tax=Agrococcus sp. HG114 TaxID=2969757 RepID=UPI00215B509E|nr:cytochrome b5-like heme/steroid binding domain-containing protein [Agrococcus sp. HG114]MCR8670388.1 cytochrome b5 domain-containing protein [Agrococcus sp. HG114]